MKEILIKVKSLRFKTNDEYLKYFKKKKIITSMWINQILTQKKYNKIKLKKNLRFTIISVKNLGINKRTTLKEIYYKAKKKGYSLVDPSLTLLIRNNLKKQKKASWIRIGVPMNSMIDKDKIPHLPKLGYALNHYFVETYWSYPNAIFYPKNKFIFLNG